MASRILLVLSLICSCWRFGTAATFSQNDSGALGNFSIIRADGTGDYTSLAAASQDFSVWTVTGVKGDYTFYIDSDLVESEPVAFGNKTNGYTVTLRPMNQPRTVTFTSIFNPYNPLEYVSHVWIGARSPIASYENPGSKMPDTSGFQIRGDLDGFPYGLSFIAGHDHVGRPPVFMDVLRIMERSHNVLIQNLEIFNGYETLAPSHAINLMTYFSEGPDNTTIKSCLLISSGSYGVGIGSSSWHRKAVSGTCRGLQVTLCGIGARQAALSLPGSLGMQIVGNYLQVNLPERPLVGGGVFLRVPISPTDPDLENEIAGNSIVVNGGATALGAYGIRMVGQEPTTHSVTRVYNNMISLNLDPASEPRQIGGISSIAMPSQLMSMAHNSVRLPDQAEAAEQQAVNYHGIGVRYAAGPNRVINNLVHTPTSGTVSLYAETTESVESDGNGWSAVGDALPVATDATSYSLLADWQSDSGQDAGSHLVDASELWTSAEDLHLVSGNGLQSGSSMSGEPDAVVDDHDGDTRNLSSPTPGADEFEFTPTADLVPNIANVVTRAITKKSRPFTKVTIYLTIENRGDSAAPRTVSVYGLGTASDLAPADVKFTFKSPGLKAGKSKVKKLKCLIPGSVSGLYAIVRLDSNNAVAERREGNNSSVYGPLP